MKIDNKIVAIFMLPLLLGACSGTGSNWPNLSDKLPDPAERNSPSQNGEQSDVPQVNPAVKPAPPARPGMTGAGATVSDADPVPLTALEADTMLNEIKKSLRDETLAYRTAVAKIDGLSGEALQDAWFSAQLALTRLSRAASRLDPIMTLEFASQADAARTEAAIIERFVVGERQRLADSEPE